jgi:hypothetical protein
MPWGRIGAADRRNPGDNNGQQQTTNLDVSGRFERSTWGAKLLDWAFTAMILSVAAARV